MSKFKKIILFFILIIVVGIITVYINIQYTFNKTNYIQTSSFPSIKLINKASEV
jgi:hypothetical protein